MLNWIGIVVTLTGGLAIFLYGMNLMGDGLNKSAGNKVRSLLESFTRNRWLSFLTGTMATAAVQSSSAVSVMTISLVKAGILKYKHTFGILLGAGIGTTVTAQVIAFKISDYALLIVALGFFINILSARQSMKLAGAAVLGFGLLFYGLHLMTEAMYPLRGHQPFLDFIARLEAPWAGILAGFLCTALIQSSSAFIGIIIVLASQGMLNLETSVALLLGSNIGTTVTAIIAAFSAGYEARRVALTFFFIKVTGVLLICFWIPAYTRLIEYITGAGNLARMVANAHTVFNLLATLVLLPFSNTFTHIIAKFLPEKQPAANIPVNLAYIDGQLVSNTAFALTAAKKEVLHMATYVQQMMETVMGAFLNKDPRSVRLIKENETKVDYLRKEIAIFLTQVSQKHLSKAQVQESFVILYINAEIEEIADVISNVLLKKGEEWLALDKHFSEAGKNELAEFHRHTLQHFEKAMLVVDTLDRKHAKAMQREHKKYRQMADDFKHSHFERLASNIPESVRTSKLHMEVMSAFRMVHSHIANIMRIITRTTENE